ncbi:hypothetical protein [Lachnoclostridium phytofermentans]|uniref:Uncharacterized protein n=1 Tax=Lachnoclostridium phytofermentans (strain ATCC 700394 / DSM 18823 / ISDg) TaxID=357809 RepID=A9KHJ8_LACP7|nr:hypothetical protein [Lachnoclostridium phytofermentans]ABX42283.1 hypothetical protein Cphy_1914 [Lachnoclostridium phytofermentans ISDg]
MLNVDSIIKNDSVFELSSTIDSIYRTYQSEKEQLLADYEVKKKECQQLLIAIDNIRTAYLTPYINQLYQELEEFGSPSKKPNYTVLLTDQSLTKDWKDSDIRRTYLIAKKRLSKYKNDSKDIVTKFLYDWTSNKKKLEVGNQDLKKLRELVALQKQEYLEEIGKVSEIIPKLKLYLDVLIDLKINIKEIILPETEGIHAFLVAKHITEQITIRQYPGTVNLDSILKLANTSYEKHYLFIKQVFRFYSNLVELLEHSISIDFCTKNSITPKEFSWILQKKEIMEDSVNEMKRNLFYIQN